MSLTEGNGMYMPVAPAYGAGYGNGFGGFGGDGWWVILFLFALMGNGFGWGGFGGNNEAVLPYFYNTQTQNDVNRGFQNTMLSNQISEVQSSLSSGFANAEVAACNRAMDAMQTAYNNQIAGMNQRFADSQALTSQLNNLSMGLQNCCCENRASIADLKYTVATEACADRAATNDALNTTLNAMNAGIQSIKDQMCNDKIDAKNEKIAELQNQLNMANLASSQNLQTQQLLTDNLAQTNALEQYLAPVPRPAYIVQNPACCNQQFGCGCGVM